MRDKRYIYDETGKEASQVIRSVSQIKQDCIGSKVKQHISISCFIMNSSSSSPVNKRKHMSEDSRIGWRRLKKESKQKGTSSVSTTLRLYEDQWKIKKTLTESDLGIPSRLLLAVDMVKEHILPMLEGEHARAIDSEEGTQVRVWDMDTKSMHQLLLKRWSSSKSYVLIGKWSQDFVRRRELHKGDEIGFFWDPYSSLFNFCVLKRANK